MSNAPKQNFDVKNEVPVLSRVRLSSDSQMCSNLTKEKCYNFMRKFLARF